MSLDPARDSFADALSFPSLFESVPIKTSSDAAVVTDPAAVPAQTAMTETETDIAPVTDIAPEPAAPAAAALEPAEPVEAAGAATETASEIVVETEPAITFADLGVPQRIVSTLSRENITAPFPIQAATIPDAIRGRDVLGRGQTGSGKTLAFGIPLLMRVADGGKAAPGHPKALILVPTRELAMQVNDAITPIARALGVFSRTVLGGTAYDKQIRDLRRGVDILVATPGRLGDLIERGECSLNDIEITVLDEADQMADMGFLPDVTALMEKTPELSQRMLFSATLDRDVDSLVKRFLHDPVTHSVDPSSSSVSTMEHHLLLISPREKFDVVASVGARSGRTIMFVRTQMAVDRLAEQLAAVGVRAGALHGGKTQRVRTRTLEGFREGRVDVLVATDVAARGIHVDNVSLVMHIDPPKDSKDYLHRAGRTARAGESGMVVTLVMPRQRRTTYSMLERAGVTPGKTEVRIGSPELAAITGARTPSGIPVRMDEPEPAPRRGRSDFGNRDRGGFSGNRDRGGFSGNRGNSSDRGSDRSSSSDRGSAGTAGDRGGFSGDRGSAGRPPHRTFHGDRPQPQRDDRRRDERGPYRPRDERSAAPRRDDRPPAARRDDRPSVHREPRVHTH